MHLGNIRKKSLSWNISLHFWKILFSKRVDVKAVLQENILRILLKENKPSVRFKILALYDMQHAAWGIISNATHRSLWWWWPSRLLLRWRWPPSPSCRRWWGWPCSPRSARRELGRPEETWSQHQGTQVRENIGRDCVRTSAPKEN